MRLFKIMNSIIDIKMKIGKQNAVIGRNYYKPKLHYSHVLKKSNSKIKYNEQFETKDIKI